MHTGCRILANARAFSVIERPRVAKLNLPGVAFISSKSIRHKLTGNLCRRHISTASVNVLANQNLAHSYLKERENPYDGESSESRVNSLLHKLEECAGDLKVDLTAVAYDLNYFEYKNTLIAYPFGYPAESLIADGTISLSLTRSPLYYKATMRDRLKQAEEFALTRKLFPAALLLASSSSRNQLAPEDVRDCQSAFDSALAELTKLVTPQQAVSLVKNLYLLRLNVPYGVMCELLSISVKALEALTLKEVGLAHAQLVEISVCVRAYVDSDSSHVRYFLIPIGSAMENRRAELEALPQQTLIEYLMPLALMQFCPHRFSWPVLTSRKVLDRITAGFEALETNDRARLLLILSALEPYPDIAAKYFKVYEELVNAVQADVGAVKSNGRAA